MSRRFSSTKSTPATSVNMAKNRNFSLEDEGSVFLLIGSLMENTGAHGIPNIKRAGNPFRRIVWALLFLFGVTMFAIQSWHLIRTFMQREVNINFEKAYESKVEFPAVTICNMNPIKSSYLMENEELFDLFYGSSSTGNQTQNGTWSDGSWEGPMTTTTPMASASNSRRQYQDWEDLDYNAEDSEYLRLLVARDMIGNMPYEDRRESGHELADMLLTCSFSGFPCSPRLNFTHFYNYRYGNCFTFVGSRNASDPRWMTTKAGPLYGLTLEMFIEQHEYVGDIQDAAGIRVTVHPHDMMPFPEDDGVSVSPGQETSIGLKRVKVRHIEEPYSNCTLPNELKNRNVFYRKFPDVRYDKQMCEKSCLYNHFLKRCNCADPRYRYNASDGEICWSNSEWQDECVEHIEEQYVSGELEGECNCTEPCLHTTFETTVSASLWPNDNYKDTVIDGICEVPEIYDLYRRNPSSFIEQNFVKISVFFNELNFDHVYDTEKYLWYNLLSDLGGQFGLWIGVSVLTVFEFIELIYDISILLMYKIRDISIKRRKNKSVPVTELKRQVPAHVFSIGNKISP